MIVFSLDGDAQMVGDARLTARRNRGGEERFEVSFMKSPMATRTVDPG
jgi:hypothetical protein